MDEINVLDKTIRDRAMAKHAQELNNKLSEVYDFIRCHSQDYIQVSVRDKNLQIVETDAPIYLTIADLLEYAKNAILTNSRRQVGDDAVAKFLADYQDRILEGPCND